MSEGLYDQPLEDAMGGRPKAQIVLSEMEREQLEAWTRRRKTAQALAMRSQVVLTCADGWDNKEVASRLRVTPQTVSKWRNRFAEQRLDGLLDAPRTGAPRTIDDAKVDAVIARTLESVPKNATHWSTRNMAREMGMFRRWTAPNPYCRWRRVFLSGAPMTTCAMARRRCSPPLTSPPAK